MKRWKVYMYAYALLFCALYFQFYRLEHAGDAELLWTGRLNVLSESATLEDSARFRTAKELFSRAHPEIGVQVLRANKDLAVILSAGGHGADLVYGMNVQPDLFEDLCAYDRIAAELDAHWIDIGAVRDENGRVFCLPDSASLRSFSTVLFVRDASALAEANISLPQEGFSYAQFRVLAQQAQQAGSPLLSMDAGAVHILDSYHALLPDTGYDSPEFRAALAFWKEMHEAGCVVFAGNPERSGALLTCSCASAEDSDGNPIDLQPAAVLSGQTVPFPTAQGSPKNFLPMRAWYLPKDSAQKELAAEFLACLASPDVQKELENGGGGMMLADIRQYDRWRMWTWQRVSGYDAYPGLDANGYFHWIGLLEESAFSTMRHSARERFSQLFPLFLKGDLSADELIAQMN